MGRTGGLQRDVNHLCAGRDKNSRLVAGDCTTVKTRKEQKPHLNDTWTMNKNSRLVYACITIKTST